MKRKWRREKERVVDILLSIRYGIPKTIPIDTRARRIIGFLRMLNGETT
jgi:endonuclease III